MTRTLVFDMDGTIADLYGVDGWLSDLRAENPRPYAEAKPLYDMAYMAGVLDCLKALGYKVVVTSWLAKGSTSEYDEAVRKAKRDWLDRYGFPYDELHFVKYGTTKADCTRKKGGYQILFDDNEKVRQGWHLGEAVDPTTENMIDYLLGLI